MGRVPKLPGNHNSTVSFASWHQSALWLLQAGYDLDTIVRGGNSQLTMHELIDNSTSEAMVAFFEDYVEGQLDE